VKRVAATIGSALLFAALSGCGASRCPQLAPELRYCLQPPGAGPRVTALHELVVTSGERVDTLLVQTENDAARLAVVGLSPLGQTLVSAGWDGTTVRVLAELTSMAPDAGTMLAFAQLGLLPLEALRAGFVNVPQEGAGEPRGNDAAFRVLDARGATLLDVRREGRSPPFARTRVELPTIGLTLSSRTLDEPLSGRAAP
jgi:hypothetical protein